MGSLWRGIVPGALGVKVLKIQIYTELCGALPKVPGVASSSLGVLDEMNWMWEGVRLALSDNVCGIGRAAGYTDTPYFRCDHAARLAIHAAKAAHRANTSTAPVRDNPSSREPGTATTSSLSPCSMALTRLCLRQR